MVSMLSKRMTGVAVLEETQKRVSLFPDAEQVRCNGLEVN